MQEILFIRHGETEWSRSGRHTGTTDVPLTQGGRQAARLLAPVLAAESFAMVLTSPRERARQTCELAGLGERAQVDPELGEWNYGDYEGLTPRQIHRQAPDWLVFTDGCPGGKSPDEVGTRGARVLARVRKTEGHVALFGHGHFLRALAARWLGLNVAEGRHFVLDPSNLSVLTYYRRGVPAVKRWNVPLVSGRYARSALGGENPAQSFQSIEKHACTTPTTGGQRP